MPFKFIFVIPNVLRNVGMIRPSIPLLFSRAFHNDRNVLYGLCLVVGWATRQCGFGTLSIDSTAEELEFSLILIDFNFKNLM